MPQARLATARLEMVPLAEEHLPYQIELNTDPAVLRYLLPRAATVAEIEKMHREWLARGARGDGLGIWTGFNRSEFIGIWMLQRAYGSDGQPVPGEAELGYRLLRRHWRQGYASEGSRELIRYGFQDLGLRRIIAHTMSVNEGSRATMASVGLQYVRTFQEEFEEPVEGHEHGEVEYELWGEDWLAAGTDRTALNS